MKVHEKLYMFISYNLQVKTYKVTTIYKDISI